MKICVSLRSRIKVSSRSIVKILDTFNEVYDNVFGNLPCANTIDLWTRKCGLDTYNENVQKLSDINYCEIIDESMMIGSNKLVISLAAPSQHQNHPLSHSDVSIVNITTAESFNAQKICDALNEVTSKVGHAPEYVITDNASAMTKGVSLANCRNHLDISHSLATFLERTYKNEPDFQEYLKDMTNIQFQHNMKHIAYILPPKQRTIARFMNIKNWINWSSCVLENYSFLGNKEKEILAKAEKDTKQDCKLFIAKGSSEEWAKKTANNAFVAKFGGRAKILDTQIIQTKMDNGKPLFKCIIIYTE